MLKITKVKHKSIAKALGIEVGDEIIALDGFVAQDEVDYLYYCDASTFTLTVKDHRTGEENTLTVNKDEGEDLGLEFAKNTTLRTCHNRCVFCFVDQMPKGMRESLYVKDDDYTMSFSCGNFVTLTNVSAEEIQRIIRLKLSPLYVSVHTMNPQLRVKLLRNRFAGKIVEQIDQLAKGGIELHCQAVIVPGENDDDELEYTARKLFAYYPAVKSLACVPTGLTKYRVGLHPISDVDKAYCERLLDRVEQLNKEFGVPFLLPADEYFVKAERPFKDTAFYGEFEQIENGVGMTAKFLSEVDDALQNLQKDGGRYALKKPKRSILISGVSAKAVNQSVAERCNQAIENLHAEVLPIVNAFFGETVTCTGLLTGEDILKALQSLQQETGNFDEVVLPGNTLKEFDDVFLCGKTLSQLKKALPFTRIRVNRDGGNGLVDILSSPPPKKK